MADINFIFDFNPIAPIGQTLRSRLFEERFDFVDMIPEMRKVAGAFPMQGVVDHVGKVARVKAVLDPLDSRGAISIIGVWKTVTDADGNLITRQHPEYPFDFALYKQHLLPIVTYDANGVEISSRRPTDAEARATQVNKYFGDPDRDLT